MTSNNSIKILIIFSILLVLIIIFLNNVIIRQQPENEKLSPYECGFEPLGDARQKFDVRFYLIAILFIIFDLEVIFIFPWATISDSLSSFGYWIAFLFLIILTIGFVYEWQKGALKY